jgi:ribosomal protein S18 acetylase RimI-like enzyme
VRIIQAAADDIDDVRRLFTEYAHSLSFDLCFQDFEAELRSLPGEYGAPDGVLLLARDGSKAVGCVALRRIDEQTCEMKRLYVRPEARHRRLGYALATKLIDAARERGYRSMKLDTIASSMGAAIALYRSLGFKETAPYRPNPIDGALFFELEL